VHSSIFYQLNCCCRM